MANQLAPSGLLWRKMDLHVHTPASLDFDNKDISPDKFVAAALSKGLDALAVTDHNTGEWVDKIVAAAKGKLVVFPGVEITVSGGKDGAVHIVALFDVTATTKTIENLLGALDIRAEKYGKRDAFTPRSAIQVIEIIAAHRGLAVLAHADSSRGLLHDMRGEPRTAAMINPQLSAVEVADFDKHSKMLDGTDPNYRRKLAVYRASDNRSLSSPNDHSAQGIGDSFTYFKIDEITLEGLRQCFCDPEVRIRLDIKPSNGQDYPRLIGVKVSKGFLANQHFEFHEGLNSIIGGKGVGKSLLIEFVRFALNQPSSIKAIQEDMAGKLRDQLGEAGCITVAAQLGTGQLVVIERTYDDSKNPTRAWYEETHQPIKGKIEELFPLLIYSQTEAIEISKDETAQLMLIDSFIEHSAITRQIANARTQLRRLDKRLAESQEATYELEAKRRDHETAKEKLDQLDTVLKSPRFEEVQKLEPKSNYLRDLQAVVADMRGYVEEFGEQVSDLEVPRVPKDLAKDTALKKPRGEAEKLVVEARRVVNSLGVKTQAAEKTAKAASDKWDRVVEKKTAEYEKWLEDIGGNRQQLLTRRRKLKGEEDELGKEVKKLESKAAAGTDARKERDEQLDALAKWADELYHLRQAKYSEISEQSGGRIKLEITRGGNRQKFFEGLSALKRGSRMRDRDIQDMVLKIEPREFVELIIEQDAKTLVSKCGIDSGTARRLIETLGSVEDFSEVLALQHDALAEDTPRVQFLKDDGNYYDLASLSMGQKCTALLIIALSQGNMPVVIDQPEDALDIPSIYQDIALQLRGRKDSRQFILTTHNPTVAVAADSDKFHILKGTATSGRVAVQGAIDRIDVRGQVIQHLEGGPEPFKLKTRKYGIKSNGDL